MNAVKGNIDCYCTTGPETPETGPSVDPSTVKETKQGAK